MNNIMNRFQSEATLTHTPAPTHTQSTCETMFIDRPCWQCRTKRHICSVLAMPPIVATVPRTHTLTLTHTQRHPFTLELGRIELNTQKTEPKLTTKYTKNNTIKRKRKRTRKLGRSKEEEENIRLICEL